ncbi:MAG TPA: PH domain-containing protein [Candidatus Saccharimonadales bacterium]|nr:PH domain-containing protein [Candidatus Saccharimonadales bacterium]
MAEFDGQRDDETVEFVFRRHIIAMRKGFYGLLIPFVFGSLPFLIFPDNLQLLWGALAGLGLGLLLFFYHWIGWYYSIFIVTNQRVQQTSQSGLFGKTVIDVSLNKVQNISYNVPGMTGEILGFGTIVLQTYVGDMVIEKAQHPEKIYNKLQDLLHLQTNQSQGLDEEPA